MKRVFSILLALCLVFQTGVLGVRAYDHDRMYVRCFMSATGREEALELIDLDGEIYLQAEDLGRAAKMNTGFYTDRHEVQYFREGSVSSYRIDYEKLDGEYYVPLRSSADELGVSYTYLPDIRTLLMDYSPILPADFAALCEDILSGGNLPDSPYFLGYIPDADEYQLATVYGVLTQSGFLPADLLSLATGHYDQELYATAYHDILTEDDGGKTELEKFLRERRKDAEAIVDFLKKEHQAEESLEKLLNQSGVSLYEDPDSVWLGSSTRDLLTISSAIGSSPISVGDLLDTYHNMNLKYTAALAYIKAVQYGTADVYEDEEKNLYKATERMTAFLDENGLTVDEGLQEVVYLAGSDLAAEGLEQLLKQTGSFSSNLATGLIKRISEYYTAGKVNATEQARVLTDIQVNARSSIPSYNVQNANYDPLALKYCTVLYLRACQVGYLNFKEEKDLETIAQVAADGAKEKMLEVLSYPDEQLKLPVKNKPLDLAQLTGTDSPELLDVLPYPCYYDADYIRNDVIGYLFGAQMMDLRTPDFTGDRNPDAVYRRGDYWCLQPGMLGEPKPVCISAASGHEVQLLQSKTTGGLYALDTETEDNSWFTLQLYDGDSMKLIVERRGEYGWINDLDADADELDAYIDALGLHSMQLHGPAFGQKIQCSENLSENMLMSLASHLHRSTSINLMSTGDVNGDGVPDAALFCFISHEVPCYAEGRKNSAMAPQWKEDCGLLLESSQGKVAYTIMESDDLIALMENAEAPSITERPTVTPKITPNVRPEVTPRPTPQPTPAPVSDFSDGTHQVVLYRDEMQKTDYGWMATAYAVEPYWSDPNVDVPGWEITGSGQLPILNSVSLYRQIIDYQFIDTPLDSFDSLFEDFHGIRVRIDERNGYAVSLTQEWTPMGPYDWE